MNVKCHKMSNVMKCQMSWNVKCHEVSNVSWSGSLQWTPPCPLTVAPDYSREISQRLSTQCLSNLFKCHPSFLSKHSFYRLTDRSNPRCYIHLRWSCFCTNTCWVCTDNIHVQECSKRRSHVFSHQSTSVSIKQHKSVSIIIIHYQYHSAQISISVNQHQSA